MATNRALFKEVLARFAQNERAWLAATKEYGGGSTWFTSYYAGADTISPKDYVELVYPYEYQVCQTARELGLFVLNWFLGDLNPILDKIAEMPIDALVLEQGRKGYEIDPVSIRQRVGHRLCIFGFGREEDFVHFNRQGLSHEIKRQIAGAGANGAFIAGTPIMPPDANPGAVDFYIDEVHRLGMY
jgi:uroporphyrinogen-III decarboxylase